MLVKLGDVWVNPLNVIAVAPETGSYCVNVYCSSLGSQGSIFAKKAVSYEDAVLVCDEYATIINNATGQSYGDGNEENPVNA